ncbi:MAG: VOC family protein [Micromonosporaceae bacterium]
MKPRANALGLVVADMAAATGFYQRLGLQFEMVGDGHAEAELAGGFKLMLDTEESIKSFAPEWTRPSGSPRGALAFQFDTPAEVDAAYDELTKAGHHGEREPWDAFWGQRYASLLDPDGNGVDLYAMLPR